MAIEKKIDENGNLLPNFSPDHSKFFKLLRSNDTKALEDWLIQNGQIKPYCPIRFINNDNDKKIAL